MATTAPLRRSTVTRSCLLLVVQDLHFARGRSAGAGQRADRTAFVRGLEGLNSRAYWKFESIPLHQTVILSPGFASVPGKTRVFRHCGGRSGRQCRQRRPKSSNIAPRRGSVSAGRYSSTAVLPEAVGEIGEIGLAISVGGLEFGSAQAKPSRVR